MLGSGFVLALGEFAGAGGQGFGALIGHRNRPLQAFGAAVEPAALGIDGAYFFTQGADLLADGADMAVALLELLCNADNVLLGGLVAMAGEVDMGIGLGVL